MSNYQTIINLVEQHTGKKGWSTQIYLNLTGNPLLGMFLDRLVWWSDKTIRNDGFFWKTTKEWEQELFISYAQVKSMSDKLVSLGFIKTKRAKANGAPTTHYWVDMDAIQAAVIQAVGSIDGYANLEKVEIQESLNSENDKVQIQESPKSLTAKTLSNKLTPNGVGETPPMLGPKTLVRDKFLELTSLQMPNLKRDSNYWWSQFGEILKLAKDDQFLACKWQTEAIGYMQANHLTITGPQSILGMIRVLSSGQSLYQGKNGHAPANKSSPRTLDPEKETVYQDLMREQKGL